MWLNQLANEKILIYISSYLFNQIMDSTYRTTITASKNKKIQ